MKERVLHCCRSTPFILFINKPKIVKLNPTNIQCYTILNLSKVLVRYHHSAYYNQAILFLQKLNCSPEYLFSS